MKKTILVLSTLLLLFSCNNDNESISNQINGKWFMDGMSCFCGHDGNYTEEYVLWNFNTDTNILSVLNYSINDNEIDTNSIYNTGQYSFTFTNNQITIVNGNNTFTFDYEFIDTKLNLSNQPELDGPSITFSPKEIDCIDDPLIEYQWLADIKFVFEANQSASGEQIIQYIYNDECVYLTGTEECCDNLIEVYNTQGEIICEFSGIAGLDTCPDFFDLATNRRVLFNDLQN